MAKSATHVADRSINDHATFLEEEPFRARLPGRQLVYPHPTFTQPNSGAHELSNDGGSLGVHYNISIRLINYGNAEKDLDGGYY